MAVALDIEIRRLRPEDARQVADLLTAAFAEEFDGAGTAFSAVFNQLRAGGWAQRRPLRWLAGLAGIEFAFFVTDYHGRIVGCTGIAGRALPVINSVAVHPDFRGLGLGAAMVGHAEQFAAEHGRDAVSLDVLTHNQPALALYQRLAYQEYHRYRVYRRAGAVNQQPARLPPDYVLQRPRTRLNEWFRTIEQSSLPARYTSVAPSLRPRYTHGAPPLVERLVGAGHTYRRVVLRGETVAGYLAGYAGAGQREARIEYPILGPEHSPALAALLAYPESALLRSGASAVRLDLSEDRPDQHHAVAMAGFTHRWTFIQMVKRLTRGVRIPVQRR